MKKDNSDSVKRDKFLYIIFHCIPFGKKKDEMSSKKSFFMVQLRELPQRLGNKGRMSMQDLTLRNYSLRVRLSAFSLAVFNIMAGYLRCKKKYIIEYNHHHPTISLL